MATSHKLGLKPPSMHQKGSHAGPCSWLLGSRHPAERHRAQWPLTIKALVVAVQRGLQGTSRLFHLVLKLPPAQAGQILFHLACTTGVALRTHSQVLTYGEREGPERISLSSRSKNVSALKKDSISLYVKCETRPGRESTHILSNALQVCRWRRTWQAILISSLSHSQRPLLSISYWAQRLRTGVSAINRLIWSDLMFITISKLLNDLKLK